MAGPLPRTYFQGSRASPHPQAVPEQVTVLVEFLPYAHPHFFPIHLGYARQLALKSRSHSCLVFYLTCPNGRPRPTVTLVTLAVARSDPASVARATIDVAAFNAFRFFPGSSAGLDFGGSKEYSVTH